MATYFRHDKFTNALLLFLLLFSTLSSSAITTVGPTNDCDFATLQTAVDSDGIEMDIRMTNTQISDFVEIIDKDVIALKGGYDSCTNALIDSREVGFSPTEITGNDANTALLIHFTTAITQNLIISGFDIHNGSSRGVEVMSEDITESLLVEFSDSLIHDNAQNGLYIVGNATEVRFSGKIYNNISNEATNAWGAGVSCRLAKFSLLENSAIYDNTSSIGAGIYADSCDIDLYAGDNNALDALEFGIFNNHTFSYGGGIRVDASHLVAHGSLAHPVTIRANTADKLGGGIYISTGSFVELFNTRLENNTAQNSGGGIHIGSFSNDPNVITHLTMKSTDEGCDYADICSSLSFNTLFSTAFAVGGGALSSSGNIVVDIAQTSMAFNHGLRGSVVFAKNNAIINFEGNLLINNSSILESDPAYALFATEGGASLNFSYLTIANNKTDRIFYNRGSTHPTWSIGKSIIANTNDAIIFSGQADENLTCSIVHNDSANSNSDADTVIAAPGFIAPDDYQLAFDSIAIDPVCKNNPIPSYTDILGVNRLTDGSADIGAYEYQFNDTIFLNGFE